MASLAGGDAPLDEAVRRILVVDDDPDINRLISTRLSARGFQVDSAANGEEALAILESVARDAAPPDLVFLDVSMPGIGGLEVLERVRAQALDLAIVMTTAFGSEAVAIEALRRGADDYLRKPFDRAEFQAILDRTVTRLQLQRQNAALRRQLDERRRQLENELARAAVVQAELLPHETPQLPGFELAGRCVPAREVGGDFFDWLVPSPGVLTLTLGDVMGKGMPAALLMATVRAALRASARQGSPAATLFHAAAGLESDLARSDSFVTLFHAQLDLGTRRLTYVDAGHGCVLLRRAGGAIEGLRPRGLPLGVIPEQTFEEGSTTLARGDVLVVYSDGLLDAQPDLELDASAVAIAIADLDSAAALVDRLVALPALTGSPPDDLTVVVLRCVA